MPHPIQFYNTLSRTVEPFQPTDPDQVKIYTCGPTVYSDLQLGNYRAYLIQDVLIKTLRYFGYGVDRVMNITDVGHLTSDDDAGEDKLEVGAKREGTTAWEVAKKYEQQFLAGIQLLHIEKPDHLVRATDTIPEQIAFIQELEQKGYTYQIPDGIYFDSSKVADYGKLAQLDIEGLQAGARVEMAEGKRRVTDFALWKFSEEPGKRDMEWESPWGVGFPGWHIECSAIALKELGPELDIHCGGVDHIPVHHTNEIAQSESLTGKPLAKVWLHNEFLLVDGGKMGKSLGNAYTLKDLQDKGINPLAFRLFTYSASFRSKLNFTWEAMESAQKSYVRLHGLVSKLVQDDQQGSEPDSELLKPFVERTEAALSNDLNMPEVMAVVWEVVHSDLTDMNKLSYLKRFEPILSLGLFDSLDEVELVIPDDVQHLVEEREQARVAKDWATADRLRAEIEETGYEILDGNPGQKSRLRLLKL